MTVSRWLVALFGLMLWVAGPPAALAQSVSGSLSGNIVDETRALIADADVTPAVDGEAPGAAHGLDVDEEGRGTLVQPRLYQLVREPGSITDRMFEIVFLDPGVEAYVFTFG